MCSTIPAVCSITLGPPHVLPGPAPDHKSYGSFVSFSDPDGNSWFVQEVTTRLARPLSLSSGNG